MNFTFLTEHPKDASDQLEFGHKEIVSTLKDIVSTQERNLTIGLFGS